MPRYEIRTNRPLLIHGQQVTPEDVLAVVDCDLPVRDVLSLVQFGNATCTEPEAAEAAEDDAEEAIADEEAEEEEMAEEETEEVNASDFADYSAKVQAALTAAGIETLAQAALYIRDHGSLEPLQGIGKVTHRLIAKQIEAAGIPVA